MADLSLRIGGARRGGGELSGTGIGHLGFSASVAAGRLVESHDVFDHVVCSFLEGGAHSAFVFEIDLEPAARRLDYAGHADFGRPRLHIQNPPALRRRSGGRGIARWTTR